MLSGLSAALSAIIAMAIDADVPRSAIAAELRRFAELLQPAPRERLPMAASDERMPIDQPPI